MIYISSSCEKSCVITQLSLHLKTGYGTMYRNFLFSHVVIKVLKQNNESLELIVENQTDKVEI